MFCFISCFALHLKNADAPQYESPEKGFAFALVRIYTLSRADCHRLWI